MDVKLGTLTLTAAFAMAGVASAQVAGISDLAVAKVDRNPNVMVTVNDLVVTFPDVEPVMLNDNVMVPMRGVFEQMGARVVYVAATREVIADRGSMHVVLPVGKPVATVNGENKMMDAPPFILNGRTMVPLRFLSYTLGAGVVWQPELRRVQIMPGQGRNDMTPEQQFIALERNR